MSNAAERIADYLLDLAEDGRRGGGHGAHGVEHPVVR